MRSDRLLPLTLFGLQEELEQEFICFEGPPRAFFEITIAGVLYRFIYATVGWTTKGEIDSPEVQTRLVQAAASFFRELKAVHQVVRPPENGPSEPLTLVWRSPLKFEDNREDLLLRGRCAILGVDLDSYSAEGKSYVRV